MKIEITKEKMDRCNKDFELLYYKNVLAYIPKHKIEEKVNKK